MTCTHRIFGTGAFVNLLQSGEGLDFATLDEINEKHGKLHLEDMYDAKMASAFEASSTVCSVGDGPAKERTEEANEASPSYMGSGRRAAAAALHRISEATAVASTSDSKFARQVDREARALTALRMRAESGIKEVKEEKSILSSLGLDLMPSDARGWMCPLCQ